MRYKNMCQPGLYEIMKGLVMLQVTSGLSFLHPTEEAVLNHACKLASHYIRFVKFIKDYGPYPSLLSSK